MKLNLRSQQSTPRRKLVSGVFSIAALFLATGAAQAGRYHDWNCGNGVRVQTQYDKSRNTYGFAIEGLKAKNVGIRSLWVAKDGTVYLNGKHCNDAGRPDEEKSQ